MKKISVLTTFLSILWIFGFAQSVNLIYKNQVMPQNFQIIQAGTPDSFELITYLDVKNVTSKAVDIYCKKSILSRMDSTESTLCWAGGCYPDWVTVSPQPQTILGGEINTEFSGHYIWAGHRPGFPSGESLIRWVFYNANDIKDSASVTVYYTSYGSGIATHKQATGTVSNAWPNPASSVVKIGYMMPFGSQGTVVIRDILGTLKKTIPLSDGEGNLNIPVSDLSDGIYFYSLVVNGEASQSKKLVIRR